VFKATLADLATRGALRVLYTGGVPDTARGNLNINKTPCQTQIEFSDLASAGLLTTFPTASFSTSILTGGDTLAGTIVMNGTVLTTATMALNGGSDTVFTINLTTNEVIQIP
jgi:hypothetical protein